MILQVKAFDKIETYLIGLRHVRNYKPLYVHGVIVDMILSEKGGTTIMSCIPYEEEASIPRIYVSRCHETDNFNKRIGLLYTIQEMIFEIINRNLVIQTIEFTNNGDKINITTSEEKYDPIGCLNLRLKELSRHGPRNQGKV